MNRLINKIVFVVVFVLVYSGASAQSYLRYKVIDGDTVAVCDLSAVTVGGRDYSKPPKFKSKRQSYKYRKMTRYVKKVYPYAQLASQKLIECEAEIQRNPESRKKAMKKVEKALRKRYGNAMRGLTVTQGKILLLLIDRQTGFTTFELVRELRGNFNASMYQGLAILFGHSLKLNYEPGGKHWMIEDIVRKIELGIL
ncbi:MAG: hypothetical protein CMP63_05065 [Flavobacteriales bacterium]|nr:hypothetical protein [Flavobacteriales bacterium]|tara:strand:- start:1352 stop:1942 length:591 start_codon:yes stop_codon:yes gene_type:complete